MQETTQIISGFGLMLTCLVSLMPICLSNEWKTKLLYLPLLGTGFFAVYQASIPVEMNIRTDMAFIKPMLLFLWINGVARIGIMVTLAVKSGHNPRVMDFYPQRRLQTAFTIPILLICGIWFLRVWHS